MASKKRKKQPYWFARMDGDFAIFGSRAHSGCYVSVGWNVRERCFHIQGDLVVPVRGEMRRVSLARGLVHLAPGTLESYTPPHIMARFIARSMVADRSEPTLAPTPKIYGRDCNLLINDEFDDPGFWRQIK